MRVDTSYSQAHYSRVNSNASRPSGDNEAVERVPDNEQAERTKEQNTSEQRSREAERAAMPHGVGRRVNVLA